MDSKLKYKAQALAIAMVVLVVSSLIAISVYSRTMKDKSLTLEERSSAEALEVSDVLIDRLTQFSMNTVIDEILAMDLIGVDTDYPYGEGVVLRENNSGESNITELFRSESLQILDSSETVSDLLNPLCPTDKGGEYQITLKEADEETYYEIKPGNVWSLPVKDLITQTDCNVNIKLAVRGDTRAGFTLMKIYCRYDEEGNVIDCKEYEYDDIDNYCFSNDGIECNNTNFMDNDNWIKYDPNVEEYIDIDLPKSEEITGENESQQPPLPFGAARAVDIDTEGNIYVAGDGFSTADGSNRDWYIRKYLPSGLLDSNWGENGQIMYDSGSVSDYVEDIVVGNDGSIYIAGNNSLSAGGASRMTLKYNNIGQLDLSWGSSGKVGGGGLAYGVDVDNNGQIYVAGLLDSTSRSWGIWKYNTQGEPDPIWGGYGVCPDSYCSCPSVPKGTSCFNPGGNTKATGIAVDSQTGVAYVSGDNNTVQYALRVESNGRPDENLGIGGAVGKTHGIELGPDNNVYVVGDRTHFYLSKLDLTLSPITSWGRNLTSSCSWNPDGFYIRPEYPDRPYISTDGGCIFYNFYVKPLAVAVDQDFATYTTGYTLDYRIDEEGHFIYFQGDSSNWFLTKFTPWGDIYTYWGNNGVVSGETLTKDGGNDLVVDDNKNVYLVGNEGEKWAVKKYLSNGQLDPLWGKEPPSPSPVQGVSDENLRRNGLFERILEFFKMSKASAQTTPSDEYVLSEIRIKAVGGTIGVSYTLPEQCLPGLRMFQLRATANCSGVYRGKEILIPEQKWHNTIFDYVIFNGEGSL